MKRLLLALPVLALFAWLWPADSPSQAKAQPWPAQAQPQPLPAPVSQLAPEPQQTLPAPVPALDAEPVAPVPLTDPATPPLTRTTPTAPRPLADPDQYLKEEDERHQAQLQAFALAARSRITELEALIEKGRQQGLSQAQLAEGEGKLAALRAAVKAIDAGEPIPRVN